MLVTSVGFLSCVERSGVFHVVQEKYVKNHAERMHRVALVCLWLQCSLGISVLRAVKCFESHLNFNTEGLTPSMN